MVPSEPLNKLSVVATSGADDAAFVALNDVAALLARAEFTRALLIGGHMVTLHARRWRLDLFRETQDADLGIPQLALNKTEIGPTLKALGYRRVRPNRFAKDVQEGVGDRGALQAVVDILVPALTSHARKNVEVGDVTTIEVPGLAEALNRQPTVVDLELRYRSGAVVTPSIKIPNEQSALVLKTLAWNVRRSGKDAVDVWRCLEIANAANVDADDLNSNDGRCALAILERSFGSERADGITHLIQTQKLNATESTVRATRLRALIARLRNPSA